MESVLHMDDGRRSAGPLQFRLQVSSLGSGGMGCAPWIFLFQLECYPVGQAPAELSPPFLLNLE